MYTNYQTFEANSLETYNNFRNLIKSDIKNAKGITGKDKGNEKIQLYVRNLSFFEKISTFFELCSASFISSFRSSSNEQIKNLEKAWKYFGRGESVCRISVPASLFSPVDKSPLINPLLNPVSTVKLDPQPLVTPVETTTVSPQSQLRSPEVFTPPKEETLLNDLREQYAKLSKFEKQQVRNKVREIENDVVYGCGRNVDFVKMAGTHQAMHAITEQLFGPFKDNLIFSLGQSPAWFTAMAQIDQPNPDRFSYVAFSGDWYGLFDKQTGKELLVEYQGRSIPRNKEDYIAIQSIDKDLRLELIEKNKPTADQTKHFRSYLSRIGCTPQRIMEQKEQEPAVFVDYINRAGGLKSFLEILFTWAEEEGISRDELRKHVIVQCMYDGASEILGDKKNAEEYLQGNLGQYSSSPVIATTISEDDYSPDTEGIRNMFSKVRNEISEQRRLIKRFTPSEWTEENCKKSSFAEFEGKVNEYILPILANFINTLEQDKKKKAEKAEV